MKFRMEAWAAACALLLVTGQALAIGTPAGTTITSQATANYQDVNGNSLSSVSNIINVTVSQVGAVSVGADNAANVSPGDVRYYPHVITNAGNGSDVIDLTAASGHGWAVALFLDVNGSGTFDAGDIALADSDTDGTPDSGTLAADGTMRILVRVTVPTNAADALVDAVTLTGTSSFNTSVSDLATDTSTVAAPVLAVVKSVSPAGPQAPGATLTYTMVVTNGGSGNATSVVLTDPIPTNTTYVGSSIVQDGTGRSDGADADSADYNVSNAGKVTVNIGTLSPGGSTTLSFQVTIN